MDRRRRRRKDVPRRKVSSRAHSNANFQVNYIFGSPLRSQNAKSIAKYEWQWYIVYTIHSNMPACLPHRTMCLYRDQNGWMSDKSLAHRQKMRGEWAYATKIKHAHIHVKCGIAKEWEMNGEENGRHEAGRKGRWEVYGKRIEMEMETEIHTLLGGWWWNCCCCSCCNCFFLTLFTSHIVRTVAVVE